MHLCVRVCRFSAWVCPIHGMQISGATGNVDCSFMTELCKGVTTMQLVARAPNSLQDKNQLRVMADVALKTCYEKTHPAWAYMKSHINPTQTLR